MKSIYCVDHHLCLKDSMFSSDIQNDGGIHILLLFTLDVCTNMNIYARVCGPVNKSI